MLCMERKKLAEINAVEAPPDGAAAAPSGPALVQGGIFSEWVAPDSCVRDAVGERGFLGLCPCCLAQNRKAPA